MKIATSVFLLGALTGCINVDYDIEIGHPDLYIMVMHGDGELLAQKGRGGIFSGGFNTYEGRLDGRHYFTCTESSSDAKCFAAKYYYDDALHCLQETDNIPAKLQRVAQQRAPENFPLEGSDLEIHYCNRSSVESTVTARWTYP
jgi:hypothetical protein